MVDKDGKHIKFYYAENPNVQPFFNTLDDAKLDLHNKRRIIQKVYFTYWHPKDAKYYSFLLYSNI